MTRTSHRRKLIAIAAGVTMALVVTIAIVPTAPTNAAVSPPARATAAERVARDFLDAYGSFQTTRALKYLTADAVATCGEVGTGSGRRWPWRAPGTSSRR